MPSGVEISQDYALKCAKGPPDSTSSGHRPVTRGPKAPQRSRFWPFLAGFTPTARATRIIIHPRIASSVTMCPHHPEQLSLSGPPPRSPSIYPPPRLRGRTDSCALRPASTPNWHAGGCRLHGAFDLSSRPFGQPRPRGSSDATSTHIPGGVTLLHAIGPFTFTSCTPAYAGSFKESRVFISVV